MTIDKSKLDKLKNLPHVKTEEDKPKAEKLAAPQGFEIGRGKSALKRACFVMDPVSLDSIDDLAFRLKKRTGKRVSASELVRTAVAYFAKLDEGDQIRLLNA